MMASRLSMKGHEAHTDMQGEDDKGHQSCRGENIGNGLSDAEHRPRRAVGLGQRAEGCGPRAAGRGLRGQLDSRLARGIRVLAGLQVLYRLERYELQDANAANLGESNPVAYE